MKILLDPGHVDGYNLYAVNGYSEGTRMWTLAGLLRDALKSYGVETETTRPKIGDNPSLDARGKMASGYDLLLSLHTNAAQGSARGVEAFHSVKRADTQLAAKLSRSVSLLMGNNDRGAKLNPMNSNPDLDAFGVIRAAAATNCPHILLIESGFHDNVHDAAWLINDDNLKKLAQTIADTICAEFGVDVAQAPALDNVANEYAKSAVDKAVSRGIIKGDDKGNLKLHEPITRQDLMVVLDRLRLL